MIKLISALIGTLLASLWLSSSITDYKKGHYFLASADVVFTIILLMYIARLIFID